MMLKKDNEMLKIILNSIVFITPALMILSIDIAKLIGLPLFAVLAFFAGMLGLAFGLLSKLQKK